MKMCWLRWNFGIQPFRFVFFIPQHVSIISQSMFVTWYAVSLIRIIISILSPQTKALRWTLAFSIKMLIWAIYSTTREEFIESKWDFASSFACETLARFSYFGEKKYYNFLFLLNEKFISRNYQTLDANHVNGKYGNFILEIIFIVNFVNTSFASTQNRPLYISLRIFQLNLIGNQWMARNKIY